MAIRIAERQEPKPAPRAKPGKPPDRKGKRGRPASGKIMVTLRLAPEIVAKFKATGPGWQARMNEALRRASV